LLQRINVKLKLKFAIE